ncbi:MAG: winged helix-turn-helix domain-containing protein [Solirubrobacteraceae bacterium]
MPDFLDQTRREMAKRLAELEPLLAEHARLQAALAALGSGTGTESAPPARPPRSAGRPRGPRTPNVTRNSAQPARSTGSRRVGRRKGSGKRAGEALSLIEKQPGVSTNELANRMGIKPNYLYRILPGLEQEGKVKKQGRGWHPAAAAA